MAFFLEDYVPCSSTFLANSQGSSQILLNCCSSKQPGQGLFPLTIYSQRAYEYPVHPSSNYNYLATGSFIFFNNCVFY